jgi:hypothetical protein
VAVAGLLNELGYDNAEKMAHETLIEMAQSSKFISSLCLLYEVEVSVHNYTVLHEDVWESEGITTHCLPHH